MLTLTENEILFDDFAEIANKFGKNHLNTTAENLSPDCNCSAYTEIQDEQDLAIQKFSNRSVSGYYDSNN